MNQALDKVGARLRNTDFVVLLASLIVVIGVLVFVAIAVRVHVGETPEIDTWLLRTVRRADDPGVPIGPKWVPEFARDLTALGGVAVLVLMTSIVTGYLVICRAYGPVCFLLVSILGGLGLSTLLKNSFHRPRPNVVPHLSHVFSFSFPSGHSMLSTVVYLTFAALLAAMFPQRTRKIYFAVVALLLAFLVGCSRVVMGVHYPTDVLAGWWAGLAWTSLCWLAARSLQQRGAVGKIAA